MSANGKPSSVGRRIGFGLVIVLALVACAFIVMCTAGSPGFLQPAPNMPAPTD